MSCDIREKQRARMDNYKEQIRLYYEARPEQKKIYHKKTASWVEHEQKVRSNDGPIR